MNYHELAANKINGNITDCKKAMAKMSGARLAKILDAIRKTYGEELYSELINLL